MYLCILSKQCYVACTYYTCMYAGSCMANTCIGTYTQMSCNIRSLGNLISTILYSTYTHEVGFIHTAGARLPSLPSRRADRHTGSWGHIQCRPHTRPVSGKEPQVSSRVCLQTGWSQVWYGRIRWPQTLTIEVELIFTTIISCRNMLLGRAEYRNSTRMHVCRITT